MLKKLIVGLFLSILLTFSVAVGAMAAQPPGQLGNHGNPQAGPSGYEGQPGNQSH